MCVFRSFDVLLPKEEYIARWPVIACDQFTSRPDYWKQAKNDVRDCPSSLHCILPEAELEGCPPDRYTEILNCMDAYLNRGIFRVFPDSYVYVERTLLNGSIRPGIVGTVDLEAYDYGDNAYSPVRATEKTVEERIPPRTRIRRSASLEMSHVLLLCDDPEKKLLGSLRAEKACLPLLYDTELPQGGGRLRGWLVKGKCALAFDEKLKSYSHKACKRFGSPFLFAVGDGNHSLAAAKSCWTEIKKAGSLPCQAPNARFAMAELVNLHEDSLQFFPIHRLVRHTQPEKLMDFLASYCDPTGIPIRWITGYGEGWMQLKTAGSHPAAGLLQEALDRFTADHTGKTDYIHGEDELASLAREDGAIGFILPTFDKSDLFPAIAAGGVLPRKTFSMGEAQEKRYYMEARKIRE